MQTFKNFNWNCITLTDEEGNSLNKSVIKDFLYSHKCTLIMQGKTGIGKTHLTKSLIYQYDRITESMADPHYGRPNKETDFNDAAELYEIWYNAQPHQDRDIKDGAEEDIRWIMTRKLVAIDDLGSEKQTEAGIFNEGLQKMLNYFTGKLIVTTNLSVGSMVKRYGEKIFSRLMQNAQYVIIKGADYRLRKDIGAPYEG